MHEDSRITVSLEEDWSYLLSDSAQSLTLEQTSENSGAWYTREFMLPKEYEGRQILLNFGGVAKHAAVSLNGSLIVKNRGSYAPLCLDISDRVFYDKRPNVLAVFCEPDMEYDSGICRNVELQIKNPVNIAPDGIFVRGEIIKNKWVADISLEINNLTDEEKSIIVLCRVSDLQSGGQVAEYKFRTYTCKSGCCSKTIRLYIPDPQLWDTYCPNLYRCEIFIYDEKTLIDSDHAEFGFRAVKFDKQSGLFLNGRHIELKCCCDHPQHGGEDNGLPESDVRKRVSCLKDSGFNAYSCPHGILYRQLLDECDRQGLLVVDGFGCQSFSEEQLELLRSVIRRDRGHASLVMYRAASETAAGEIASLDGSVPVCADSAE